MRTVTELKARLMTTCKTLRHDGKIELAEKWESRLKNIPAKMSKEAINHVLFSACFEAGEI